MKKKLCFFRSQMCDERCVFIIETEGELKCKLDLVLDKMLHKPVVNATQQSKGGNTK